MVAMGAPDPPTPDRKRVEVRSGSFHWPCHVPCRAVREDEVHDAVAVEHRHGVVGGTAVHAAFLRAPDNARLHYHDRTTPGLAAIGGPLGYQVVRGFVAAAVPAGFGHNQQSAVANGKKPWDAVAMGEREREKSRRVCKQQDSKCKDSWIAAVDVTLWSV